MKFDIYQQITHPPTNKLAFIDIDNTLSTHSWDTQEKDLLDSKLTNQAIDLLQRSGYLCILNTSRTEEMCMSSVQYELSQQFFNFKRPKPHIGLAQNGKRFYLKPEDVYPVNILDLPIIISSSGAKISILQNNKGYREDTTFYPLHFPDSNTWRKEIVDWLLKIIQPIAPFKFASIESEELYLNNSTDIFPADYRIQLSVESQQKLQQLILEVEKNKNSTPSPLLNTVFLTNDSHPDKNTFTLYITPKRGKVNAIEHVAYMLSKQWNISSSNFDILIIGDSYPDFEAGMQCNIAVQANITLLLVGGSRISSYLTEKEKQYFTYIDMSGITNNMTYNNFPGYYTFTHPKTMEKRTIVISDLAFPKAIGPRSIVEFLQKKTIIV